MKSTRATLLLTRPEAQSRRFAATFHARFGADWPVLICPLMRIRLLEPDAIPRGEADLIFTSENAVAAYAALTGRRCGAAWCVGRRSEEAARREGFATRLGPGDAAGLIDAIRRAGAGRTFVWPRALHAARDIAEELTSAGIETIPIIVYDQSACEPTPDARRLMRSSVPVLLPLFSPRSAALAASAFPSPTATLLVAAISPAVARAAESLPSRRMAVAARPDAAAMLAALAELVGADMTA